MTTEAIYLPKLDNIYAAAQNLYGVAIKTPLHHNRNISNRFYANILLKREDLQPVRSFKIRGAYNKMAAVPREQLANGVVCASAGNHAQGVAFACSAMKVKPVTSGNSLASMVSLPAEQVKAARYSSGASRNPAVYS